MQQSAILYQWMDKTQEQQPPQKDNSMCKQKEIKSGNCDKTLMTKEEGTTNE